MFSFAEFGNDLYTGRRSYDIVGRRRVWYTVAVVVVVGSVLLLAFRGLNAGIEFRGGSEFRVSGVEQADLTVAERAVTDTVAGAEAPRASSIGENTVRVQTEQLDDAETDRVAQALAEAYGVEQGAVTSSFVGPSWGEDVSSKAIRALVIFLVLVGVVIALYFRTWKMAAAALAALLHDLVVTVGIYALIGFEVTPATVIGFLTILGYSLYDTVVVFDKVRENTEHVLTGTRRTYGEAANLAINQTLVRSINTSVVAVLPVAAILFIGAFLLGAGTLRDISLVLLIGTIAGTYSSIFLATPMLVDLKEREPEVRAQAERVATRRASEARRRDAEPVLATSPSAASAEAEGSAAAVGAKASAEASAEASDDVSAHARSGGGQRNQPRRSQRQRGGRKR
jgi:preprotein translocase subunit SecF